jgi:PAS domain S-box-containing protein
VETAGAWREEDFFLLRLAAEIIGTAIQRKRSEEALERLRRQQALILDSAGDGIYGLDRNGLTSFINPAATRMLGWQAEDLIGRPMHPILHHSRPDGKPYPLEECPIYAAFKDGSVHSVYGEVFWRKDGTSLPAEYVSTPIREHGDIVGAVVVFRDISERQQADEALRASEARLHLALKATNLGIWDWDIVTGSVVWSNEVERLFGLPTGAFAGTKEAFFELIHPEDRSLVSQAIRCAVEDGAEYEIEHRIVKPDGSVHWLACAGQVLRDQGGRAVRMLGTVMDVTSRKQSEATFRQSVTGRKQP